MLPASSARKRRHLRDLAEALLVGALGLVATALAAEGWVPFVRQAETWYADTRTTVMARPSTEGPGSVQVFDDNVVIIAIRETSLAGLPYLSPIDRGLLAGAVEALGRAGVRAVGLDVLVDRPTEPDKDARLRRALLGFPGPVVVAYADATHGLSPDGAQYLRAFSDGLGRGWPNVIRDGKDGTVRWLTTTLDVAGDVRLGFAAALATALGYPVPEGRPRLDYRVGGAVGESPFRIFPIEAVGLLPKDWIAGRVALIGADFRDTDRIRAPKAVVYGATAGMIPGVVVHAHMLAQIIDGRSVPELGFAGRLAVAFVAVAAGLGLAVARLAWPARVALAVAVAALLVGAGVGATWLGGPDVPLIAPMLGYLATFSGGVGFVGRRDRRRKRFIRHAFARFVAPTLVAELEANPERLTLGGERREVTFVFSDIAGFTSLSEGMDAQELGRLLNEYFDGLCAIVMAHDGTIDKLIGDAVVAFFGAPIAQPDHARKAVACAVAMDAFAERFRVEVRGRGISLGVTRIGVHGGEATVGNFGGRDRFNYTALGDTVNTASRLEGANKALGTRVCVSGPVAERCPGMVFRPVAEVVVKGRKEAVAVVEPIGEAQADASLDDYRAAYEAMRRGDEDAVARFERLAAAAPEDAVVALHLKRLRRGDQGVKIVLEEK
ncbi:MAG: CHASE2 domain-containing protein [Alphaproteobacteria bacterium]